MTHVTMKRSYVPLYSYDNGNACHQARERGNDGSACGLSYRLELAACVCLYGVFAHEIGPSVERVNASDYHGSVRRELFSTFVGENVEVGNTRIYKGRGELAQSLIS